VAKASLPSCDSPARTNLVSPASHLPTRSPAGEERRSDFIKWFSTSCNDAHLPSWMAWCVWPKPLGVESPGRRAGDFGGDNEPRRSARKRE
jgi:hypothetical protein